MGSKARIKFALFVLGLGLMIPMGIGLLTLLSQFVASFQQGADPASIFRGHTLVIPAPEQARWLSINGTGEPPSLAQQEEILAAYWLAWEALSRAQQTGDPTDLKTYWAGAAYQHALAGIDPAQRRTQTHSGHALRLRFLSEDGSVVTFTDDGFALMHRLNGDDIAFSASAWVVMTLDQGFWRIRQIRLVYE